MKEGGNSRKIMLASPQKAILINWYSIRQKPKKSCFLKSISGRNWINLPGSFALLFQLHFFSKASLM